MKKSIFTIVAKNYIGLAQILNNSIRKYNNDIDFFNDIRRDFNNPVPVRVDYSGKSSESCDQNCPNRKTNPWPKK